MKYTIIKRMSELVVTIIKLPYKVISKYYDLDNVFRYLNSWLFGDLLTERINMNETVSNSEIDARSEIIKILENSKLGNRDRIVLTIDPNTDHPKIEIQKLVFPLGEFFKNMSHWKTIRFYSDVTYYRLLQQLKIHPEWLAFDVYFEFSMYGAIHRED